jgi:hypothetical protein
LLTLSAAAAATAAGETVVVDVPAPEEYASHALVVVARGRCADSRGALDAPATAAH